MAGAKALVEAGRLKGEARYAVIGEPTSLRPIRLHKGVMVEAIRLRGRSGHSSNPSLGVNALEGMHAALGALLDWRRALETRHHNSAFAVPFPTMNPGVIHGGDAPNRICGFCELQVDLRPLPGMEPHALHDELEAAVHASIAGRGLEAEVVSLIEPIPPFETPATSQLVRAACEMTGFDSGAVAFGTEGPFLRQLGLETIVMGPGDIAQAHQPDEFLALDQIDPAVKLIERLIGRFCCG